jgi:NAD+ synthase (glutamine-hydrolysing)
MNKLKITGFSMKTTTLGILENFNTIQKAINDPEFENSNVLVFPELCITGYGCEDAFFRTDLWSYAQETLIRLLPYSKNKIIIVGLPIFDSPFLYNTAVVMYREELLGIVPKENLANTGIHYEKRWFREGKDTPSEIMLNGKKIPFGNIIFKTENFRFGIEICEDSWVANRKSVDLSQQGADIIFSIGASHFSFKKQEIRRNIFKESSRSQNNLFVYTNLNGNESGRIIFEGGTIFALNGQLISEGKRMHFTDYSGNSAIIDLDFIKQKRSKYYRNPHSINSMATLEVPFQFFPTQIEEAITEPIFQEPITNVFEDFSRAVSLGMFDYLKKTNSKGYSLSLSGGADSSACAILVMIMKKLAKQEINESIFSELGIDENNLLVTIYQGTKNNSVDTKNFAKELTLELSINNHYEIEIDDVVETITENVSQLLNKKLNWKEHDLPLQNIQARVRSPIVWLLANLNNHLLISTGNRSEASVGYTTMDGDSSGSICPISGVSKEFVLQWLNYIKDNSQIFPKPLKSLSKLLTKRPTAELKPLSEEQEDEKDLMEYPLLQKIEREYVYNGRNAKEIFEILKSKLNLPQDELKADIEKFISMFHRNQWKRERLPPGFHLDEYSLDSRGYFRFPILSKP